MFELIDSMLVNTSQGRYTHRAVAQTSLPYFLYNPENRSEYIRFDHDGLVLPSGSVLTTALNTMASMWICYAYANAGDIALDNCGYKVTRKSSPNMSEVSFLGAFFFDDDMEYKVVSDPAVLLRSFGSLTMRSVHNFPRAQRRSELFQEVCNGLTDVESCIVWFNTYQRVVAMASEGDALYLKALRQAFHVNEDDGEVGQERPPLMVDQAALGEVDHQLIRRVAQSDCAQILGEMDPVQAYLNFCLDLLRLAPGVYISSTFFAACMHNKYGEDVSYV